MIIFYSQFRKFLKKQDPIVIEKTVIYNFFVINNKF